MHGRPFQQDPLGEMSEPTEPVLVAEASPGAPQSQNDMNGEPLQRKVRITNPHGFHVRPATKFAQLAGQFQSTVTVCKGEERINGKSPIELLLLAAEQGTELTLEVAGPDAGAALEALAKVMAAPSPDDMPAPPLPPKG